MAREEHYSNQGIETIDVIEAALGTEGAINFCHGNIIKYATRANYKNQFDSDIDKIATYANMIIELKNK